MRNFFKIIFILFGVYFFISSCNQNKHTSIYIPKCDTFLNLDTPRFKKENIINRFGYNNPEYINIQNDVKRAGLKLFDKGYDSIAIRLFFNYLGPEGDVLEIRKHCEGWIAEYIKIKRRTENEKIMVDVIKNEFVFPKSGWAYFTNQLLKLGITTLPDYSEIPNYNASNDGNSLTVEISTNKHYRIYTYLSPKTKLYITEAKKIEEIIDLIKKEFGIKMKSEI